MTVSARVCVRVSVAFLCVCSVSISQKCYGILILVPGTITVVLSINLIDEYSKQHIGGKRSGTRSR